jgi:hypothetical protein
MTEAELKDRAKSFPIRGPIPIGFMTWTVVGRDRWARRVSFVRPSGPALPPIANPIVQYLKDIGIALQAGDRKAKIETQK